MRILVARCTVDYQGRLAANLPEAMLAAVAALAGTTAS